MLYGLITAFTGHPRGIFLFKGGTVLDLVATSAENPVAERHYMSGQLWGNLCYKELRLVATPEGHICYLGAVG